MEQASIKTTDDSAPRNDTEVKLVELFTSALNITCIGIHESFFDSGGTQKHAQSLILEVNSTFDLKLKTEDLAINNTIAKLAKLAKNRRSKLNSTVIPLNKNDKPPLFLICGIALYGPLAKNLKDSYACYGIYVPEEESFFRNNEQDENLSIPDLAKLYVAAIRKHTPTGPYTIAGVSFGGVLAFEIARQFELLNQEVSGLIILDAVLPGALKKSWQLKIKFILKKLKYYLLLPKSKLLGKSSKNKKAASAREHRSAQLLKILKGKAATHYFNSSPTFYKPTLIIRAADQGGHKLSPDLCWGPMLKGEVFLSEAPGSHLEILKDQATANFITTYIQAK